VSATTPAATAALDARDDVACIEDLMRKHLNNTRFVVVVVPLPRLASSQFPRGAPRFMLHPERPATYPPPPPSLFLPLPPPPPSPCTLCCCLSSPMITAGGSTTIRTTTTITTTTTTMTTTTTTTTTATTIAVAITQTTAAICSEIASETS